MIALALVDWLKNKSKIKMKREFKPKTTRPTKKYTRAPRNNPGTTVVKSSGGLYFPRTRTVTAPLPQTFRTTLHYAQYYSLNPDALNISVQTFRLNGIQDPDFTGVGHQPRGFDELTQFYGRYTVVGCNTQVHLMNSLSQPLIMAFVTYPALTTPPTPLTGTLWREVGEYPKGNIAYRAQPAGTSNNQMVIRKSANMAQLLGVSDILSEADAGAVVSGNPNKSVHGSVWVGAATTDDLGTVVICVKLSYDVVFQYLQQLQSS